MGIERLMLMSKSMLPGLAMVFRPASPNVEPVGLTQFTPGTQNAPVLNHSSAEGFGSEMDWPGTTLARCEPLTPRAMSTEPPRMLGVKYRPEAIVKSPLHCQFERIRASAPFCAKR